MEYDVIIIGSGLAGLTSGALLAKKSKKVLMLEQHHIVGGCATAFKRKNFNFDVSLHELDGFGNDDLKTEIFKELNIFDNIEFIKLNEFYRVKKGDLDIVLPYDIKKVKELLVKRFPNEKKGIDKFFDVIIKITQEENKIPFKRWKIYLLYPLFPLLFPRITKYQKTPYGKFIDSIIIDDTLKIILSANIGFYHDNPYELSMLYYSPAQSSYFKNGCYYIKGGGQTLSDYLANVIKDNGGEVLVKSKVEKIITEKNKVVGVKTNKEEFLAKIVIANSSIPQVVNHLIDNPPLKIKEKINRLKIGPSFFIIYLGLKKGLKELGNKNYLTFVFDKSIKKLSDLKMINDYNQKFFSITDYSQINEGKICTISTLDQLSNWENLTKNEYKKKKIELAETLLKRAEEIIPRIKDNIEVMEVATPKTMIRYTLNENGTAYGFAQTQEQAGFKRIRNKGFMKNLYFASAWSFPGGGYSGAILSGYYCYKEIIG